MVDLIVSPASVDYISGEATSYADEVSSIRATLAAANMSGDIVLGACNLSDPSFGYSDNVWLTFY